MEGRITVEEFKGIASKNQVEALKKLKEVFSDDVAYEEIVELEEFDGDYLAEIFTVFGSLVATVNISKMEYLLKPNENLCIPANNLNEFNNWLYSNKI